MRKRKKTSVLGKAAMALVSTDAGYACKQSASAIASTRLFRLAKPKRLLISKKRPSMMVGEWLGVLESLVGAGVGLSAGLLICRKMKRWIGFRKSQHFIES